MTDDCVKADSFIPEPGRLNPLVRTTGFIPGTLFSPDIYFADDPRAARVAVATYLVIHHLDRRLQLLIRAGLERIICSFSPQNGGSSMEACLLKGHKYPISQPLAARPYASSQTDKKTIGRFFDKLDAIAVYAVSNEIDDQNGWSQVQAAEARHLEDRSTPLPLAEKFHRFSSPTGESSLALRELFEIIDMEESDDLLTDMLCEVAGNRLYGKVPLTIGHELAHFFEPSLLDVIGARGNELYFPSSLTMEIRENIAPDCPEFGYFRDPREALAELTGCAVLERIREKTRCNIQFQTDGLETVLPKSYKLAKYALSQISRDAEPLRHYQPMAVTHP